MITFRSSTFIINFSRYFNIKIVSDVPEKNYNYLIVHASNSQLQNDTDKIAGLSILFN